MINIKGISAVGKCIGPEKNNQKLFLFHESFKLPGWVRIVSIATLGLMISIRSLYIHMNLSKT